MVDSEQFRLSVTRAEGAAKELVEETARSLLHAINDERPGHASFVTVPAEPNTKQGVQITVELMVGMSGVASAWIVPVVHHWLTTQSPDTGLWFKSSEYEVEIKGNAPPEVFTKVTQAIEQATKG
jgi:hypothetical protein